MLRDRIAELEKKNVRGGALAEAKVLLGSAADRVTGCMTNAHAINWQEAKDRSVADRVRSEILEALMALKDL